MTVTSFKNGWCPAQNIVHERAKRAAAAFDERVVFEVVDTAIRETFLDWGICDALFIDGKGVRSDQAAVIGWRMSGLLIMLSKTTQRVE